VSQRDNSPFGASGIRHATVRIKNDVKLGMTTNAKMMVFHFSLTLKAAKYATGKPISKHINVAITEIRKVDLNVLKNVSSKTSE
jgi:endonuclease IV